MKLYATTTSERASKGQGGNKYIKNVWTCENEETKLYDGIAESEIVVIDDGAVEFRIKSLVSNHKLRFTLPSKYTKGKKQKGNT